MLALATAPAFAAIPGTWVSLGPTNVAGRTIDVAFDANDEGILYALAETGGLWKSTDRGASWAPLTDQLAKLGMRSVAVSASNPSVVYLGLGVHPVYGGGLMKSTNGGSTWASLGFVDSDSVGPISISPANANHLVAGTSQGVFRSTNGGASFTRSLGLEYALEIVRRHDDASVLYAISAERKFFKSTDGGLSFTLRGSGLPASTSSTLAEPDQIALADSDPSTLYLVLRRSDLTGTGTFTSHVFRSTDAAASWTEASALGVFEPSRTDKGRVRIVVDPQVPQRILLGEDFLLESTDGGESLHAATEQPSARVHALHFDRGSLFLASELGVASWPAGDVLKALDGGLVTTQIQTVANDPIDLARVLAGFWGGALRRPDSGGTTWTGFTAPKWTNVCAINPDVPSVADLVVGGVVFRVLDAESSTPTVEWTGIDHQFWLTMVPDEPRVLYSVANGTARRSSDGGSTWAAIPFPSTHFRVAVAPGDPCLLLSNDFGSTGVARSTDCGASWQPSSPAAFDGIVEMKPEFDPNDAGTAYLVSGFQSPAVLFRSVDGGATWTERGSAFPSRTSRVLRVDPRVRTTLYAGTEIGLFRSTDEGSSWHRHGTGLPHVPVNDIQILEDGSLMRIATSGRGVWELEAVKSPFPNRAPIATLASPAGPLTVERGTTLRFSGSVSDPDAGDAVSAKWTFTDDWQTASVGSGPTTLLHRFSRTGDFPVALTARDEHGTRGSSFIRVTVVDPIFTAGDATGDGQVDISDVFYLINFIFAHGPAPIGRGDVNHDAVTDISDVFFLINYIFANGPAPD